MHIEVAATRRPSALPCPMPDERFTYQGWQGAAPDGADYIDLHVRMHLGPRADNGRLSEPLFAGTEFEASVPASWTRHSGVSRNAVVRHFMAAMLDYLEGDLTEGPRPGKEG